MFLSKPCTFCREENVHAQDMNVRYAQACLRDCLLRGESPYASHLLYTQEGILNDDLSDERLLGIQAGFAWKAVAQATILYVDRGISTGMRLGVADALSRKQPVEYRALSGAVVNIQFDEHGLPEKKCTIESK